MNVSVLLVIGVLILVLWLAVTRGPALYLLLMDALKLPRPGWAA